MNRVTRRYRIVTDGNRIGIRYGVIDQAKLPLVGQWCHSVHSNLNSAMNWVGRQR